MIRVNLLPSKKVRARAQQSEGSQTWLMVVMAIVFVEAIALFFFHQTKERELNAQKRQNQELSTQIADVRSAVSNHDKVKQELSVFRQREEAVAKLQSARTGPSGVLLELSHVLTSGRAPSINADRLVQMRKDNPLAVPNPAWDARRLWVLSFKEAERTVTIEGLARDGEDVSEFARRLAVSSYFSDVKLLPASKVTDSETKLELLKFQLQAKVNY